MALVSNEHFLLKVAWLDIFYRHTSSVLLGHCVVVAVALVYHLLKMTALILCHPGLKMLGILYGGIVQLLNSR